MKMINPSRFVAYLASVATRSSVSAVFLSLVLAGVTATAPEAGAQPLRLQSVFSSGLKRWYWVQLPSNYSPTRPTPVVVGFHGGGGNARRFVRSNSLAQASADRGYLAVFPEGTGRSARPPRFRRGTWNGGNCCGFALREDVDDVQFFRDLLADLSLKFNVDPARVYATGMSNGALMAYRVALEASDLVAAIAPVAGAIGLDGTPSVPVPVIAFHGLLDQNIPFGGGAGTGVSGTDFFSQAQSIQPFFNVNQCIRLGGPIETIGEAVHYLMPSLTGHDIEYWLLRDGGHSWPGTPPPGSNSIEPINVDIDASETMLDFFDTHVRS